MRYSIPKILAFALKFEKQILSQPSKTTDLSWYIQNGLLNIAPFLGKKAKPGFSLTGKPYPEGYTGGFNPDGSGLPTGFDDDLEIDKGMNKDQINSWIMFYLGETDPYELANASSLFAKFRLASKILLDKSAFIESNTNFTNE